MIHCGRMFCGAKYHSSYHVRCRTVTPIITQRQPPPSYHALPLHLPQLTSPATHTYPSLCVITVGVDRDRGTRRLGNATLRIFKPSYYVGVSLIFLVCDAAHGFGTLGCFDIGSDIVCRSASESVHDRLRRSEARFIPKELLPHLHQQLV